MSDDVLMLAIALIAAYPIAAMAVEALDMAQQWWNERRKRDEH